MSAEMRLTAAAAGPADVITIASVIATSIRADMSPPLIAQSNFTTAQMAEGTANRPPARDFFAFGYCSRCREFRLTRSYEMICRMGSP
jgi:hypothetical protein